MSEGKKFCQKTKWLEAREAWIAGDKKRAKEIEMEIHLHMNPWSWVKEQTETASEETFGTKRTDF